MSASKPLHVVIPGVATITGSAGAFHGRGTITVESSRPTLPFGGSLTGAGTGIDVTFAGVTLTRPLIIAFNVAAKPQAGDVPVVAHQQANGKWTLTPARAAARLMTVAAQTFSVHVPAWLNPDAWLHWLGDRLASLIGGRTSPINCPSGAPAWASVTKQTDEAHDCLIANPDPASHVTRAEVQIKSNRGVALQVTAPAGSDYTWVQDQPWAVRSWVWARFIHQDPNTMVLLPPGGTMTAGYEQPAANEDLAFQIAPSYWSLGYSLIGDIIDALTGLAPTVTGIPTLYFLTKCSGVVDYGSLSVHKPVLAGVFASALQCVLTGSIDELSDPRNAVSAARTLLGPSVDDADAGTAVRELVSVGSKLIAFAWIVKLWPVFQAGWGELADVLKSLLTDGASTLITLHMRASGAPPASSVSGLTPAGAVASVTSGIVHWADGYWFAVAAQQSSGQLMVTIYQWQGLSWVRRASLPVVNADGSLAHGELSASAPITAGALTGAATPDFLVHSYGADTDWLNVVSGATGHWAVVPFNDTGGPTVGENLVHVAGNVITVGYDNCLPDCASGHVTTVRFHYASGAFALVDAPGSCTGDALAVAAHAYAPSRSPESAGITGFTCAGGYAAATASNGLYGWTLTFRRTSSAWQVLASGNLLPGTGIPAGVYQQLKSGLSRAAQDLYYPY